MERAQGSNATTRRTRARRGAVAAASVAAPATPHPAAAAAAVDAAAAQEAPRSCTTWSTAPSERRWSASGRDGTSNTCAAPPSFAVQVLLPPPLRLAAAAAAPYSRGARAAQQHPLRTPAGPRRSRGSSLTPLRH